MMIVMVRRIYWSNYDAGKCSDFSDGEIYFDIADDKTIGDSDYGDIPIYEITYPIAIGSAARKQFDEQNWTVDGNFWLAQEDVVPVSEDLEDKIRAIVALTGGIADADIL